MNFILRCFHTRFHLHCAASELCNLKNVRYIIIQLFYFDTSLKIK